MSDDERAILYTASGGFVDILNPQPETIVLHDIAVHLARECRFSGAVALSVAEHSLNVAHAVRHRSPREQLRALLHDGSEYLLRDLPWPLKRAMPTGHWKEPHYRTLEHRLQYAIYVRFGVYADPPPLMYSGAALDPTWLKHLDAMMVRTEARKLLSADQHAELMEKYPGDHYVGALPYWGTGREVVTDAFVNTAAASMAAMEEIAEAPAQEEKP